MFTKPHAQESGHWYSRTGEPVYEVPGADGKKMVTPDIRHARKLGLLPGATSIIRCAAAPGLERWKQEQVLLAALTLPRGHAEPDQVYVARVLEDSQEQGRKAAQMGTAIHAAIQGHYEGAPPDPDYWPYVQGTVATLTARYGAHSGWKAEESFANPLGYGGKKDLCRPGLLLDFKGKDFTAETLKEKGFKLAWDENCIQLAAYRNPGEVCANVFFSRSVPGLVHIHQWTEEELQRGWAMFESLLRYWHAKNKYNSAFQVAIAA